MRCFAKSTGRRCTNAHNIHRTIKDPTQFLTSALLLKFVETIIFIERMRNTTQFLTLALLLKFVETIIVIERWRNTTQFMTLALLLMLISFCSFMTQEKNLLTSLAPYYLLSIQDASVH